MQVPEQRTGRRATGGHNKTGTRLYQSIPDHVDHVPNPEYLCPDAEKTLFGLDAPTISVPRWRPFLEFEDGQEEVELSQAGPKNLSRQDEAILFRRYNCARYHLASLMEKQVRRFARGRVPEILAWYRRVLENRATLIQANMALVVAMAKRVRADSVEFGELVSEGNMALLRALDKFDFSRGFKFSTYACCAILKAFSRLVTQAGTYRQRFSTSFEPEMERSDELERRHDDQHELALEDLRRALIRNRARLTDVERTVLGARFAVVGHDHVHTLQEVGGLLRLSSERVRQVQNEALTKLRRALELTSSPETTSRGMADRMLADLATALPGRLGPQALAVAECGR
jgi:RNA polymerase sigma factor (sigma-70 family)